MGLLDKMKNLFTEEIEEEPVKTEVMQVEIPAPVKKEEIKKEEIEDSISDSEVIKKEEKVVAPIFFDDSYFKELEQPKVVKKEVKSSSYMKEKKEEKKFTPTPIISPVYGVLDKNYNKEDITTRKERESITHTNTSITIDDVRKKAYGTLEDDIETTLFGSNSILFSEKKEEIEQELLEDLIDDEEINIVEEEMDNTNIIEDILDEDSASNSELFDLIDSMYEKEGK